MSIACRPQPGARLSSALSARLRADDPTPSGLIEMARKLRSPAVVQAAEISPGFSTSVVASILATSPVVGSSGSSPPSATRAPGFTQASADPGPRLLPNGASGPGGSAAR